MTKNKQTGLNNDYISMHDLETYAKERVRKHIASKGFRLFEHPSFASVLIVVKDNKVLGTYNYSLLRDNAHTNSVLVNPNEYLLEFKL